MESLGRADEALVIGTGEPTEVGESTTEASVTEPIEVGEPGAESTSTEGEATLAEASTVGRLGDASSESTEGSIIGGRGEVGAST